MPAKKKPTHRYVVVGDSTVDGAEKGEVVVVKDEARALALIQGGHVLPEGN